ncbi:MAG: hypothetical protein ICV59_05215 [Thermoleophilia bacterium]|nr:hypothetical protein [Thermoleophilia bacterium]
MRLLIAELLKLWTTPRTTLGLLLGMLAVVALGTVGMLAAATDEVRMSQTILDDLLSFAAVSATFALIVGVLVVTWEWRHGTMTETFLAAPRRERVVGAKALAAAAAGAVLAAAAVALTLAVAYVWISDEAAVDFGAVWATVGRLVLAGAIWGVLGVGIGALVRSQVAAIVLVFVWFFVLEPLLRVLIEGSDYLPGAALQALTEGGDDVLSSAGGALVATVYAIAAALLGTLATLQRDVA